MSWRPNESINSLCTTCLGVKMNQSTGLYSQSSWRTICMISYANNASRFDLMTRKLSRSVRSFAGLWCFLYSELNNAWSKQWSFPWSEMPWFSCEIHLFIMDGTIILMVKVKTHAYLIAFPWILRALKFCERMIGSHRMRIVSLLYCGL